MQHYGTPLLPGNATHPTLSPPVTIEDEKLGSLIIIVPTIVFLAAAWGLFFSRRHLFGEEGMPYLILTTASFAATSIAMNVLNKVCVTLTGAPSTLTTIQMAFAVVVTMAMNGREVLECDRKKALRWMVVPVMYAGMLNSSLLGYKYLSLSLVTVFRNLAPLLTMAVEGLVMDPQHRPMVTAPVVGSMLMMVLGALVFSSGQADATWFGLFVVMVNAILAISDRLLQRRLLVAECKDLPLSACVTINNFFGMLPTFAMAFAMHEGKDYQSHAGAWKDPQSLFLIALSGCMGMGIGFFGLMVQKAMTATSFQVLQNGSKLGVITIGVFVFGDRIDTPARIFGMFLSLVGSACYGYAKSLEPTTATPTKGERAPLLDGRFAPFSGAKMTSLLQRFTGRGAAEDLLPRPPVNI